MTWLHAGSTLTDRRPMAELEQQAVDEVLQIAAEYDALPAARKPGFAMSVQDITSGRQRAFAVSRTGPEHPAWPALMALLDGILASHQELIVTKHGIFDVDSVTANGGRLTADQNGELLQFPDAKGIFRTPGQRHAAFSEFRAQPNEPEWWQTGDAA